MIDVLKAFIIHLDRAQARKAHIKSLRDDLPIESEIVTAVDAQTLSPADRTGVYRRHLYKPAYPFLLSDAEIACFISHRKAWTHIIESDCDVGFVLEDDASLEKAKFLPAFALACDFVQNGQNFIRFAHRQREKGLTLAVRDGARLIQPYPVGLGAVAYLINRGMAAQLLEKTKIFDRPVDVFLQMFWLTGVRPLTVLPSGVSELSAAIGGTTLHKKLAKLDKLQREILRPLYRWRLRQATKKYNG